MPLHVAGVGSLESHNPLEPKKITEDHAKHDDLLHS